MSNEFFVTDVDNEDKVSVSKPKYSKGQEFLESTPVEDTNTVAESKSPSGYVPVKLSSNGRLGVPSVIHVKDYTGRDVLDMSMSTNDNQLETLANVIKNITYEDIDVENLHENDLEEILINVYLNFWANALTDIPFPVNKEDLETLTDKQQADLESGDWKPTVDLPLKNLETKLLDDKFKEPIKIQHGGRSVTFVLPRIGHLIRAGKLVSRKYIKEESRWNKVTNTLRQSKVALQEADGLLRDMLGEEYFDYIEYTRRKTADLLLVKQAMCIVAVDDEVKQSVDEKIKAYDDVTLTMWQKLAEIQQDFPFGVNHEIEVVSPLDNKLVVRRFSFRLQDFFPEVRDKEFSECTVSFG